MKSLRIAVTGLNASYSPGPGVPVIRALREEKSFNGEIIGLTYDPFDPGIYMDGICDHSYIIPYPSEGYEAFLMRIKDIHAKTPFDVIIPTLDAELSSFMRISNELNDIGVHLFLPEKESFDFRSKVHFHELAERYDIQVPRGKTISDPATLLTIHKEFDYPVMIKGQYYEAYIAYSSMEADHIFRKISAKWGLPVIIQEFIVGEEYDITALGDGRGNLIGAVPMKKMQLTDAGKAWGGITIKDDGLMHFVENVVNKLKWRGPCELEVMKSKKDSNYYLIEINPRFPAWCYLLVAAGQNLQWATVRLALGENVEPFKNYQVGTMFIRNSIDHIYPLSQYQEITTSGELHK